MVFVLGIDIGSAASKGVALGDQGLLGSFECPSGGDFKLTAERVREELLSQCKKTEKDVSRTVATGYGSKLVF
ncbi:MAG: 2-hydroxyglutaryl-CoA dehydratase, partial [Deltaproteobacteria bacterium]|nr:2-hydroxyglutaryl-CoA dehydratase [Deltaproteobacteria bacterium]